MDDILIKSCTLGNHVDDLETFATLHRYNMKLNPVKCAFEVMLGKFLGFMVSHKGLKPIQKKSGCGANRCPEDGGGAMAYRKSRCTQRFVSRSAK